MRARNLKPGFFKDEKVLACEPLARILFEGLWCYADREGRFCWTPFEIRIEILPLESSIDGLLNQLLSSELIIKYSVNGKDYGYIPNFPKHQHPHVKEKESTIPAPDKHGASTIPAPDETESCPSSSLIPSSLIPDSSKKVSKKIPFVEIVQYLNFKTDKNFSPKTKETQNHIKARWHEGYREQDFFHVIDVKCAKWLTDPKMIDFLRPKTLFGTKFESYLNEKEIQNGGQENRSGYASELWGDLADKD